MNEEKLKQSQQGVGFYIIDEWIPLVKIQRWKHDCFKKKGTFSFFISFEFNPIICGVKQFSCDNLHIAHIAEVVPTKFN